MRLNSERKPCFHLQAAIQYSHLDQTDSDHEGRAAWLGQPFPLDTSTLPIRSEEIPSQYGSLRKSFLFLSLSRYGLSADLISLLELGYAAQPSLTLEQRRKLGENVEHILSKEKEAAKAPPRDKF